MATIEEVSRLANVSPATVSRVMNNTARVTEETRKRVMTAVDALNYQPDAFARGLVTKRSGGVGVTVNHLSSPYYGTVIEGIESVITEAGMHLLVSGGNAETTSERAAVEFLRQRRADALIVQVEATPEAVLYEWASQGTPLVVFGHFIPELAEQCVYLDNEAGGRMATHHLIEHGHTRIAHITGPLSIQDSRARLQGYRLAHEAAGLPFDEDLVVSADYREEGGKRAATRLLGRRLGFTALFAGNDQMAAGVIDALDEAGLRVPEDISVVGYDDLFFARYLRPKLTTVRQPLLAMGKAAAHVALALLRGEKTDVTRMFQPELVSRQSVRSID